MKNYTYDADGQLTGVEATKEPWSFAYDPNGNMQALTYSTHTIPIKYDAQVGDLCRPFDNNKTETIYLIIVSQNRSAVIGFLLKNTGSGLL